MTAEERAQALALECSLHKSFDLAVCEMHLAEAIKAAEADARKEALEEAINTIRRLAGGFGICDADVTSDEFATSRAMVAGLHHGVRDLEALAEKTR